MDRNWLTPESAGWAERGQWRVTEARRCPNTDHLVNLASVPLHTQLSLAAFPLFCSTVTHPLTHSVRHCLSEPSSVPSGCLSHFLSMPPQHSAGFSPLGHYLFTDSLRQRALWRQDHSLFISIPTLPHLSLPSPLRVDTHLTQVFVLTLLLPPPVHLTWDVHINYTWDVPH